MLLRVINVAVFFIGLYLLFGFIPKGTFGINPPMLSGLAFMLLAGYNLWKARDPHEYEKFKQNLEPRPMPEPDPQPIVEAQGQPVGQYTRVQYTQQRVYQPPSRRSRQ